MASLVTAAVLFVACSSTMGVPDGDHLYVGIDKINYTNYEKNDHFNATQEEVEAALACPANGALFGSSYHRSPFQPRLWIWNAFHDSHGKFGQWMMKSFAKPPVLMSSVTPELRASVAQSALNVHGYFNGKVTAHEVEQRNPKKAKVRYDVDLGHLYTLDSISYVGFPKGARKLIDSLAEESLLSRDMPFDVSTLDAERNRLATLFRDNGYFYYQSGYASYLADTIQVPGKVQLRLQLADSLPDNALRKWFIGQVDVNLRKNYRDELNNVDTIVRRRNPNDTISRRRTNERRNSTTNRRRNRERLNDSIERYRIIHYKGNKSPLRKDVVRQDLRLRPGNIYEYSQYQETLSKLTANGLFSSVDFRFTPADTTRNCRILNVVANCVFDKPYDFYVETNLKGKTTGFLGPQLIVGFTKRNAFKGGEKLDINLRGSYEWQTGHAFDNSSSEINSYEYGGDISLEFPRIVNPFRDRDADEKNNRSKPRPRRRYFSTPSTILKASTTTVNRSGYFKRHIVSGELTYKFQPSRQWIHQITPLMVEYNYLKEGTDKFYDLLLESPYLVASMMDIFIPKFKYTVMFSSPTTFRNPIYWDATVSESGNLLSLGYMVAGKKWNEQYKEMFKNPYAQFFKVETNLTKTWSISDHAQLVGHLNAGAIWAYGNSEYSPYTEDFWVGGANSIRAFTVRSIGPGNYRSESRKWRYIEQVGDFKLQANLEYRPRLFGDLYGAVFLDVGNVWDKDNFDDDYSMKFSIKNALKQMAVGTGVGLRYDMDFFVIRIDWGIGLHAPYETGKSGFYNIRKFRDGQSIHFAIGYPF